MKKLLSILMILFTAAFVFAQEEDSDDVTVVNEEIKTGVNFGVGLTPGLTDLGFCNYFLRTTSDISVSGSISTPYYNGGLGAGFGLNKSVIPAETYHKFNLGKLFEFATFDYYTFDYKDSFKPFEFYSGNIFKVKPFGENPFFRSIYVTGEYLANSDLSPQDIMTTAGLETYLQSDNYSYLLAEPYAFVGGFDPEDLNFGLGFDFKSCIILADYIGVSENFATRYALCNFAGNKPYTHLCVEEYYRGEKREELEEAQCTFSTSTELFFNSPDFNWTLLNFLTFIQIQAGPFVNLTYNNEWAWCSGGFTRFRVSMGGGDPFFGELGYGYNSVTESGFFIIGLATAY